MKKQKKMKTNIYLFNNSPAGTDFNIVYAMAETGEVLAQHCCSHISFMNGDLHDNRPERQQEWNSKYPNGYEIISLPQNSLPPTDVLDRNEMLGKSASESYHIQLHE